MDGDLVVVSCDWLCCVATRNELACLIDWGAAIVSSAPASRRASRLAWSRDTHSSVTGVLSHLGPRRPTSLLPHPTHLTLSIAADFPGASSSLEIRLIALIFHNSRSFSADTFVAEMAPSSKPAAPPYAKEEKVLCFHHDMLYEAKIIEIDSTEEGGFRYKIHYKGWKATWDDWVPQDRIRKLNDENRELAAQLNQQARASMQKKSGPAKKTGLKNGSDFSSARGSEERSGAAATMSGRGRKRDFDLENVSARPRFLLWPTHFFYLSHCVCGLNLSNGL